MGACVSQQQKPTAPVMADGVRNPYLDGPGVFSENKAKDVSSRIDKDLEEEGKSRRRDCKILLLGAGESGKSTVVKQMKIIHQNGYTREELMLARMTIFKNILESAQAIVLALRKFQLEPFDPENRDHAEAVISYRLEPVNSTLLPSGGVSYLSSPLASYPTSSPRKGSASSSSDLPSASAAPVHGYVAPANDPAAPYHYSGGASGSNSSPTGSTDEEEETLAAAAAATAPPGLPARKRQRRREIAQRGERMMAYAYGAGGSYGGGDAHGGLTPEIVVAIESLWKDPTVQRMVSERQSDFYLMDSAEYFFKHIRRIGSREYVPDQTDYLHCRVKTTGITETFFRSGQLSIHMFDVGGQRSERKKWIHCFEGVTSIIFCVALSEYDQTLLEETGQNRLCESLVLFESVINSRWFVRTSIILFLNKIDLFRAKLPRIPLEKYFPEYQGGSDINKAAKYILWRFTQLNRQRLAIYPHLTQATDTSNIRLVFAAVRETILQNALRDSGIL